MTVNTSNPDSLRIYCAETSSCSDMTVNLLFTDKGIDRTKSTDNGTVHCIRPNSCDNLWINVTDHTPSQWWTNLVEPTRMMSSHTQLFMYEHSDNVVLENHAGYFSDFDNIVCITDEWKRFVNFILFKFSNHLFS